MKWMSTYSNRLQPALQNLLQCVVWFFHQRSSCPTHISVDVCSGRQSLVKPVTWQNISSCLVLSPEIVMHDEAYIGEHSENNIKCVMYDDLGWKNRTTRYILPRHRHWLQFHRCGTHSVLSRHSIAVHTRSSADADNGLDAFSGQSRSTNMVPFWVHCDFSLSMW